MYKLATLLLSLSTIASFTNAQSSRIVGGELVRPGTYPWFTMLLYIENGEENFQSCGGSLVSPEWVLTANHCIDDDMRTNGAVRIGAFQKPYKEGNNGGQDVEFFRVDKVVEHPQYDSVSTDNDFTLLRIKGESKFEPVSMDFKNLSDSYETGTFL